MTVTTLKTHLLFLGRLILRELIFESEALKVSYIISNIFKTTVKHLI